MINDNLIYVFDTNALYDYFENDEANSVIFAKEFRNDFRNKIKVIPSICILELFVKNRNKPKLICQYIKMIFEEEFYLSTSQFVHFNAEDLYNYFQLSDDFLRIYECNTKYLLQRVDIEARLLYLAVYDISIQFAGTCAEKNGLNSEKCKLGWIKYLKDNNIDIQNFFIDKLKEEFNNGNEKRGAKRIWNATLLTFYKQISITTEAVAKELNKGIENIDKIINKKNKKMKKSIRNSFETKTINEMLKLNSKDMQTQILNDIDVFSECLKNSKRDFTDKQLLYFKRMIRNWVINGKSLDKNDINDLQYFYTDSKLAIDSIKKCSEIQLITSSDLRFISFDADMYSFIREQYPSSYSIIKKYLKKIEK